MDGYFARQPILDIDNKTTAYEILYRNMPDASEYAPTNDADSSTASVITSTFFGDSAFEVFEGKKLFINFTENLLLNGCAKLLPKDSVVIEVLETVRPTMQVFEALADLRIAGYTVAVDDFDLNGETAGFLDHCDIVKIDFRTPRDHIEATAAECRRRKKIILAEKVETEEEVAYAKSLGCSLMQGYFFAKPMVMKGRSMSPMLISFLRIVELLNDDNVNLREVASIIETDAALTYKLLKLVNSIRHDWMQKVSSVLQAVKLIGINKAREWIYLVGLQKMNENTADELIVSAFFRARFCESLANAIRSARRHAKELYLMGLMSAIVNYSNNDYDTMLKDIPLSDNIKSGLTGGDNVFADIFNVVVAFETADWDTVDSFIQKYNLNSDNVFKDYLKCLKESEQLMNLGNEADKVDEEASAANTNAKKR